MKSIAKKYSVVCPCEQRRRFDILVQVKNPPATGGGTHMVEKYCPFCDKYVEFDIPDEPFEGGRVTRE